MKLDYKLICQNLRRHSRVPVYVPANIPGKVEYSPNAWVPALSQEIQMKLPALTQLSPAVVAT